MLILLKKNSMISNKEQRKNGKVRDWKHQNKFGSICTDVQPTLQNRKFLKMSLNTVFLLSFYCFQAEVIKISKSNISALGNGWVKKFGGFSWDHRRYLQAKYQKLSDYPFKTLRFQKTFPVTKTESQRKRYMQK